MLGVSPTFLHSCRALHPLVKDSPNTQGRLGSRFSSKNVRKLPESGNLDIKSALSSTIMEGKRKVNVVISKDHYYYVVCSRDYVAEGE